MTKDIKKEILTKINKGEVKIKSKNWFHFIKFGAAFLMVILALSAVAAANYLVYIPKRMGALRGSGIGAYFSYIPILLFFIIGMMILISVWLYKEFEGGYKKSFLYLFSLALIAIIIIGSILAFSGLNERLEHNPQMKRFHDWQQDSFGPRHTERQNQIQR